MTRPSVETTLPAPETDTPVLPPPPVNEIELAPEKVILPPFCAFAPVMPPALPIDVISPTASMRLPIPSARRADGTPPFGLLIEEPGVNWIRPPFSD